MIQKHIAKLSDVGFQLKVMTDTGILAPIRPDRLARMLVTFGRQGTSPATAIAVAAIRHPNETFISDEAGDLTFSEVHIRTNSLANALKKLGVGEKDRIGIMCRNHRGFIETMLAASKLGATSLFLNTMFSGPQLADVVEREEPKVLIYDEEFEGLLSDVDPDLTRVVAWHDTASERPNLERLIKTTADRSISAPSSRGRFIILTSGTTGTPKGAQRESPKGLSGIAGLLDKIPHRTGETVVLSAPLFHSWGFINSILAMTVGAKLVLDRKFNPELAMSRIKQHAADVFVAVPIMVQRILELPEETRNRLTPADLKITALSGSALAGGLATAWMDCFGDNLYNLYGSTEVAFASIATPADLRIDPSTAGRPPHGTEMRLIDDNDRDVESGETGRIFIRNGMTFEGYTGGGTKSNLDGYVSSGDVGHVDELGLLYIDGRDDDMIVSGGENVFPAEVEDLLASHQDVLEVAVVGQDDEDYGQSLVAYIAKVPHSDLSEEELRSFVKANLASFKTPKRFIFRDTLPRNGMGKIVKRDLVSAS